jgi:hypothetical protein
LLQVELKEEKDKRRDTFSKQNFCRYIPEQEKRFVACPLKQQFKQP